MEHADKALYFGLGLIGGLVLNRWILPPAPATADIAPAAAAATKVLHSTDTQQLAAAAHPASGSGSGSGVGAPSVSGVDTIAVDHKSSTAASGNERLKMMLVVRQDLNMQKGKIAAQCSHAAVGLSYNLFASADPAHRLLYHQWTAQAQPKIVVRVANEQALMAVAAKAEAGGVHSYLVVDAGRTQVAPNSKTVLALGPAPAAALDPITKALDLL